MNLKQILEDNSRLIGIDPGNKNIGFAICDENQKVATPLKIINKKVNLKYLLKELNQIIKENDIRGWL